VSKKDPPFLVIGFLEDQWQSFRRISFDQVRKDCSAPQFCLLMYCVPWCFCFSEVIHIMYVCFLNNGGSRQISSTDCCCCYTLWLLLVCWTSTTAMESAQLVGCCSITPTLWFAMEILGIWC